MNLTYWTFYHIAKLLGYGFFRHRVIGRENLALPGGALIVSNHASFLDPPCVGIAFDEPIHYLARKSLFANPLFGAVIRACGSVPVDQERPDMSGVKSIIRLLRQGEKVLVFPEGSRNWDGKLLPGEPGTGLIVAKANVPVIPIRIFGTHEALPRGGKWVQPSEITVVCGRAWTYNPAIYDCEGKALYRKISTDLMDQIAALSL